MKHNRSIIGALMLVGVGLLANAAVLFFRGNTALPTVQASNGLNAPILPVMQQDGYFVTTGEDGRSVYLWYFDYSPQPRDSSITHMDTASTDGRN